MLRSLKHHVDGARLARKKSSLKPIRDFKQNVVCLTQIPARRDFNALGVRWPQKQAQSQPRVPGEKR
jgi:hypothetical protein